MQFEEFDNKIREAAEHHHPAYHKDAWDKMEKMLDKHLPQPKEKKRRFIFFILFALLLGGAGLYFSGTLSNKGSRVLAESNTSKTETGTSPVLPATNKTSVQPGKAVENNGAVAPVITESTANEEPVTTVSSPGSKNKLTVINQPGNSISANNNHKNSLVTGKIPVNNPVVVKNGGKSRLLLSDHQPITENNTTNTEKQRSQNQITAFAEPVTSKPLAVTNENKVANTTVATDQQVNKTATVTPVVSTGNTVTAPENKTVASRKKTARKNQLFLFMSAAPDISFAGSVKPGTLKAAIGGGLGYTIKQKLTVRAGFFTAQKVYTAEPYAYHGNAAFYTYYPNLQSVDGNCRVYEIPLLLTYHFGNNAKHDFYAGTGISSYLMKKETYTYFYKTTAGGPVVNRSYSIQNKNNHYFSVLTLSGGYERKLGNSFSVSAEPYVKIPFSGVGLGKVKLNSAGVLFSVGYSPFNHSKKTSVVRNPNGTN